MLDTKTDSIITFPSIKLYQVCRKTTKEEVEKLCLVERIKSAMETSWAKVFGLAAVQIGVPVSMAWFRTPSGKEVTLINPEIHLYRYPMIVPGEGCASIKDKWYTTQRYQQIKVKSGDEWFVFNEMAALIAQHLIDHCAGILVPQREVTVDMEKVGRNDPCPECLKNDIKIKFKKCKEHNK